MNFSFLFFVLAHQLVHCQSKMSLNNKVAIVTGASSGIGAATAVLFAREGANVVIVGRNEQKLRKVREACTQAGGEPLVVRADVSNEDDARRIVNDTINRFGQIDVLVNNAAIARMGGILADDVMEVYDAVMNTNLRGQVYITHLAAPHLIKTRGNIINISSIVGVTTSRQHPTLNYSLSKAALNHFTRLVAAELSQHGVRVNTVCPGPVKTDLLSNAGIVMPPEKRFDIMSESEEIADLILFLASDKAKAVTGSNYVSDNGALLV